MYGIASLVFVGACQASSCQTSSWAPSSNMINVPIASRATEPAQVVAMVNDQPIVLDELKAQMSGGASAKDALGKLIVQQLLVQEAQRRRLNQTKDLQRLYHKALATRLIQRDFSEKFTPQQIPQSMIEAAYQANLGRFVYPELVEVAQILAPARRANPPEVHKEARRLIAKARAIAISGKLSPDEFKQIADLLNGQEKASVQLIAQQLKTSKRGYTINEFSDLAFALKSPGDVSPILQTFYGYHLVYLIRRIPARNTSLAEASPEIIQHLYGEAQRMAFDKFLVEIEKKYQK